MKNIVTRSSAKAEFKAMTKEICELLWMKQVLEDLKIKCEGHMKLFCDNKSTISSIKEKLNNVPSKRHIKIDIRSIRDTIKIKCEGHNHVQHDTIKHIENGIRSIKDKLNNVLIQHTFLLNISWKMC